jgi:hypothetical protein
MNCLNNVAAIVEVISQQWAVIKERAGDDWAELEPRLLAALRDLANAKNEAETKNLITELLFIGYHTPASSIFRRIMRAYPLDGGLVEASRLGGQFTTQLDALLESKGAEQRVTLLTLKGGIAATIAQLKAEAHMATSGAPVPRYLNAGFFTAAGVYVEPDRPLALDQSPYQLVVNIGDFWGPGAANQAFPALPDELYDEDDTLTLDIVARTSATGFRIPAPPQTLSLPKVGDSQPVSFDLEIAHSGRFTIDADVFYHGHLLQSRRTEFKVVQDAGEELPPSAWPVQDGYITFTRTADLTREALAPLAAAPRRLTILAERDPSYQNIVIRVYDNSGDGLALRPSLLTDTSLAPLLNGLRNRLLAIMEAYTGDIGGSESELAEHLGQLANAGYAFYRNLLPDLRDADGLTEQGLRLRTALLPGGVIQIAPLSAQVSVPWELVYERTIHSQRLTLCPTFREHGPDLADCPHHDDSAFVCPHGFWGYRYIIEQLPCRVGRNATLGEQTLPFLIPNIRPLQLTSLTYDTGNQFTRHWRNLLSLGTTEQLQVQQVTNWDEAGRFFTNRKSPANLVYFYTHGGKNDIGQPYLQISDGSRITMNDLDAWQVNWRQSQPLVVINACESADYDPDDFESLILFFSQRGAVGVIGTQCAVKEKLADAFILPFFAQFLRQMPAGAALFAARRQLLYDHFDPRGLAYSLFAAAEVKLAQPIFEPEI